MGWELKKLGDLCEVVAGQSPEGKFYNNDGVGLPFYQGKKEFGTKYVAEPKTWTEKVTKKAESGDILMSVRAPVGPINFSTQNICIGRGLAAIKPLDDLSKDFLFYFLLSKQDEIKGNEGAVFASINKRQIEQLDIPYVALPEQKRIVAILDQAFASIEKARSNAEQNLKNARELFDSFLNATCNNQHSWPVMQIGDVCNLFQGIAINKKTKHLLVEKSSLPLLRIKDLKNNCEEQYVREEGYPVNSRVFKDDILYTRTGSLGLVFKGRSGVLHNNSFKVVPNESIDKNYLFWWLQHPSFKDSIFQLAFKAAQPDITHAIFKIQKIGIPPLSYQYNAVQAIEKQKQITDRLFSAYEKKLAALNELKKSILQKAFSGELTQSKKTATKITKEIAKKTTEGIPA